MARMHAANALLARGEGARAAAEFAAVLHMQPLWLMARLGVIRGLLSSGDFDGARSAASHPALLDARDEFATALADFAGAGAMPQRANVLRAFVDRHPDDADAALALAASLHALGRNGDALHWANRVLELQPDARTAREIRATALIDRGDVEAGLLGYPALLSGGSPETVARHLVLMHYDPAQSNASLFAALDAFARGHLPASDPGHTPHIRDRADPLCIGWISPRFGAGPVAIFLADLLARFDRTRFRHVLVDLMPSPDASSRQLLALGDEVVELTGLDDNALLVRLRALKLDIAIDLTGHSTGNRLAVLARRVAPLQVCWLDWFDSTAVPTMDAWISDRWLTPADSTQVYSEQLVRLESGRFSYSPMVDVDVSSTREAGQPVTLGSFNRLAKLNDGVVDAWARILQRIPDATLVLRARLLDDPDTRTHIATRFAARGIGMARLDLVGELPYRDLLEAYRQVDIALDPFPFSGCTTTCDALWMGCPTITLPGETFVSRQSASLAWRLGHDEWVATRPDDYVDRAVALASNVDALRRGRANLRAQVERRLCNASEQAIEFAHMLATLHAGRCREMANPAS
jgi:protein O-GlcNAc transferase